MATVHYTAPAMHKGKIVHLNKTGAVVWLQIGPRRVKCVLQDNGAGNSPDLVHLASGQKKIVSSAEIASIKTGSFVSSGCVPSDRWAAESALARLIDRLGAEKVLAVMADAPILNA